PTDGRSTCRPSSGAEIPTGWRFFSSGSNDRTSSSRRTPPGRMARRREPRRRIATPNEESPMSADAKLAQLGITLPTPNRPLANYVPGVQVGNLLFLSGHGPIREGSTMARGKVGRDLSTAEAYKVARDVGINLLASARSLLGSLDRVKRVVKVLGMVNAMEDFGEQPQVINGFSDLMVEVF